MTLTRIKSLNPHKDKEFEQRYPQAYIVPEVIRDFLTYFQKCITEQNLFEIQDAYENGYVNWFIISIFILSVLMDESNKNLITDTITPDNILDI